MPKEEFPEGAWVSLAPGYRGLEVERTYGGVRQRWVLVESAARGEEERGRLEERIGRVQREAEGVLRGLLARRFACERDARGLWRRRAGGWPTTAGCTWGVGAAAEA